MRDTAWLLKLSLGALSDWNQGFDEAMRPLKIPDNRGKAAKITAEMVRVIVRAAQEVNNRGRGLRLKRFTDQLGKEHDIHLSKRKVREVLIANGLFAARTRNRRPRFYQNLRKDIPNGLVSLDGSQLTVWLDSEPHKFTVELSVDVKTFAHTAFWIGDTESSDGVIEVLEAHRKQWGVPLGMLCDCGSSNLSDQSKDYLQGHGIELLPAGPANPKGNGIDEGAFSHMKRILGRIQLDLSSARALARSVLEHLISLYVRMRNRIPTTGSILAPAQEMQGGVSKRKRDLVREELKGFSAKKVGSQDDQGKLDQLHGLIRYHGIAVEPAALKRAEKSIKAYEKEAISEAERIFLKATAREPGKKTLPYFFGILKRIQEQRDDEAYSRYCLERYNEQVMTQLHREQQESQEEHSVEGIVRMLVQAVKATVPFVKELAITKAHQWTQDLMESYRYPGALKNNLLKALDALTDLTLDHRMRILELIERLLNPKTMEESVTQIS